ncbi:MAG TPA: HAMP domain-containing sensor histidine kinase [Anaeromyxobacteraceae bacterium]|nr:HAMP domain-containing sensor histidine kinase [Anaeromyxobacteraceae bacterium]
MSNDLTEATVHVGARLGALVARLSSTLASRALGMHGFVTSRARGLHHAVDVALAAAAHELRTPLAVVRAEAQLLARETGANARLTNITRQVDRLTHLVEQLLEAARVPFGPAPSAWELVDLRQLLRAVVRRFERSPRRHVFRMSAGCAAAWIRGDPQRIALALANVIDNAVRFSPKGGVVDVALRVSGREARVSVRDQGIGIPLRRQGRVFEPLYRPHAGTDHDHGGIGLGLALTRRIVTDHGGAVSFTSTAGRGSTFALSLPVVDRGAP